MKSTTKRRLAMVRRVASNTPRPWGSVVTSKGVCDDRLGTSSDALMEWIHSANLLMRNLDVLRTSPPEALQ